MGNGKQAVLVTGYEGFLGSHLVKYLEDSGYKILRLNEDIRTAKSLPRDINAIVHLAAKPKQTTDLYELYSVNVAGTANILSLARATGVKKFVFASSSKVYSPTNEPLTESSPCQPDNHYGLSKLMAENICKEFSKDFEVTTFRFANIYGQMGRSVINAWLNAAKNNKPMEIIGPRQELSFVYVQDCVEAIKLALQESIPGIYNVSDGNHFSFSEVCCIINKINNYSHSIQRDGPDTKHIVQNDLLRKKVFEPKFSLEDGIKETWKLISSTQNFS